MGVVKFPVKPRPHLSEDASNAVLEGGSLISCHESVCSACGEELLVTEYKDAVAVPQNFKPVPVRLEIKKCPGCGVAAVAGDDWREHGYFVFGAYAVHVTALVDVRVRVESGTPITTAWGARLARLRDDRMWLKGNPLLASRVVGNDGFLHTLLEVYLAFEALTDHPYAFSTIVEGFFPQPASRDGRNMSAANDVTLETVLAQGEEQVVDVDLSACWLVLSMLSPMVFPKRLRFVYTPPMAFSPHTRKSNVFVLMAKGGPRKGPVNKTPALLSTSAIGEGSSSSSSSEKESGEPASEVDGAPVNVYDVWRLAAVDPPVQRGTDLVALLAFSAEEAEGAEAAHAVEFANIARRNVRELRRRGRYSVGLFEVVAVLNTRLSAVLAATESLHGGVTSDAEKLSALTAFRDFSSGVLASAAGSTTGEVPALPAFYRDLPQPNKLGQDVVTSVAAMVTYAEAKEDFIATKLRPADSRRKAIAVQALRSGAPFGAAVYRPKAVQIWASHGNPTLRASKEAKQVDGFDISFNVMPPEYRRCPGRGARVPRRARNEAVVEEPSCAFPDSPSSRGEPCRCDHGGVECGRRNPVGSPPCSQLQLQGAKINLNTRQRQQENLSKSMDKSKKQKYSSVLGELDFDRLAFMGTLVNEMGNEAANHRSLNAMVKTYYDHTPDVLVICQLDIYSLGRCWCDMPLLRSYDQFGRAQLAFLE